MSKQINYFWIFNLFVIIWLVHPISYYEIKSRY